MSNEPKFEVIFAIVNNGFADQAMLAAREAGAKGGTITHARGSSNIGVDKKYGITMTPEKEILMILATSSTKDAIMDAVYKSSIKENNNKGVVFSLPVADTAGIKLDKYKELEVVNPNAPKSEEAPANNSEPAPEENK